VNSLFFRKKLDVHEASVLIAEFVSMQDGPPVDGWIIDISRELNINSDSIKNEVLYLKAAVGYIFITERYGYATFIRAYMDAMNYMHSGKDMFYIYFQGRCVEYSAVVHGDDGSGKLFSKDGLDKITSKFVKYLSDEGSVLGLIAGFSVAAGVCKVLSDVLSDYKIKI
jgi:hypothetical protein